MYRRHAQAWLKHFDFMVLDLLVLQIAFLLSYIFRHGIQNPYSIPVYSTMSIFLMLCDLSIIFFTEHFSNILRRGYYREFVKILQQTILIELFAVLFLFPRKTSEEYSRTSMFLMGFLYAAIGYCSRLGWKQFIKKTRRKGKRSLLIVTNQEDSIETITNIRKDNYGSYRYAGLILVDGNYTGTTVCDIPVVSNLEQAAHYVQLNWVDEVFISLPEPTPFMQKLADDFVKMGITVHLNLAQFSYTSGKHQIVEKIGNYTVLTTSMNYATTKQAFFKRTMEILGGVIGCLITAILFVFVAPFICIHSHGPIFFTQERIGKNGKIFKMYKFRSMYMDAEARKEELLSQNKLNSDLMFKMVLIRVLSATKFFRTAHVKPASASSSVIPASMNSLSFSIF